MMLPMSVTRKAFKRLNNPTDIILQCVRWYHACKNGIQAGAGEWGEPVTLLNTFSMVSLQSGLFHFFSRHTMLCQLARVSPLILAANPMPHQNLQ